MKTILGFALLSSLAFVAPSCFAQAKDAPGCKDSPLLSRFPGSILTSCEQKPDKKYDFQNGANAQTVEGEYQFREYQAPKNVSNDQLRRNYLTALRNAGYAIVFEAQYHDSFVGHMGKTWIRCYIRSDGGLEETIVKETALTQDVVATPAELSMGISGNGHSVINGIYFDTGKAEVKSESAAALKAVVELLSQDLKLHVYVVGHTDNVGAVAANMDLSKRRAAAVVHALSAAPYNIAPSRMLSFGDGPTAPVASNDTEDGRARNRRVELVKQ
jgi:outer membrane protein OmpA-like peptidoglycan-associated protein